MNFGRKVNEVKKGDFRNFIFWGKKKNEKNCLSDPITEYRMYRNKFILNEIDLVFVVVGKLRQFRKNKKIL